MTNQEHAAMMAMLRRAKDGDELSASRLTQEVAAHFEFMIRGYKASDPAYDYDDLMQRFRLGIYQHIEKADERGDPIYHLAQRGAWSVRALLHTTNRRRNGTPEHKVSVGVIPQGYDLPDRSEFSDPQALIEMREEVTEAHRRLTQIRVHTSLTRRECDVFQWFLDDEDSTDPKTHPNKRLAGWMGITEQRASQLRNKTISKLATTARRMEEDQ